MNKNKLIIVMMISTILAGWLYGKEFNNYSIIEIRVVPTGREEGMIGWEPRIAGGYSGPTAFVISDKYIYVPDRVNYRINVYDHNFNFVKTIIEEKKESHFAFSIKVDANENLISLLVSKGLKKINQSGKSIFFIPWKFLSNSIQGSYNYFPINNEVFIYNDQGEVQYIDNSGKIETANKAIIRLQEITMDKKQLQDTLPGVIKVPADKTQIIETLRNSKKYLLAGDCFYSTRFRKNREYFEKIKDIREYVKSEKLKIHGEEKKEININLDDYDYTLFGYDEEHNGYWGAGKQADKDIRNLAIIILSKYGEILDGFYFGQLYKNKPDLELYPASGAEIAVAPSGDVYFLAGSKEKYTLYKVERRW